MKIEQTRRVFGLVTVGAGVMLIGVVSFVWLNSGAKSTPEVKIVPVTVSYPAPSLQLNDLTGKPASLDDYRGQVVLVNLWATWCAPCKDEMPALQAFYDRYKQAGFTVVAIDDGESFEDVSRFVSDYGLSFPIWLDPQSIATREAFRTVNLPSSFVVDRSGTIRLRWVGGIDPAALEEYVAPLILE